MAGEEGGEGGREGGRREGGKEGGREGGRREEGGREEGGREGGRREGGRREGGREGREGGREEGGGRREEGGREGGREGTTLIPTHTFCTSTPSAIVCLVFSLYPNILEVRSFTEARLMTSKTSHDHANRVGKTFIRSGDSTLW